MAELLTSTTELEALNYLLISIGEQPINDLNATGIPELTIGKNLLHVVSRQVQTRGLHCNTESGYPIPITTDGKIIVPNNALKIDATDESIDVVRRGSFLYDKDNHTDVFEETLEVDVVWFLAFNDLPQVVRDYIVVRTSRLFQTKVLGSEALHAFSAQDEAQAWANLVAAEIDTEDLNILSNPSIISDMRRN